VLHGGIQAKKKILSRTLMNGMMERVNNRMVNMELHAVPRHPFRVLFHGKAYEICTLRRFNEIIVSQRCTSLNIIRDPYVRGSFCPSTSTDSPSTFVKNRQQNLVATQSNNVGMKNPEKTPPSNLKRSLSQDSVYTILIRLPIEGGSDSARPSTDNADRDAKLPSIKMFSEDPNLPKIMMSGDEFGTLKKGEKDPFAINTPHQSYEFNSRLPLNAKIIPRKTVLTTREKQQQKAALNKKKKSQEKRQESKAAKTLSAILLSFIITWTPYNILVLLKPITSCTKCIPQELWDFFYALCYINSTINPVCYALCNASFRRTYVRILTCKWQSRNREAISRGVYN
jgi:muscarinic acetylcholine receptor M3